MVTDLVYLFFQQNAMVMDAGILSALQSQNKT